MAYIGPTKLDCIEDWDIKPDGNGLTISCDGDGGTAVIEPIDTII